MEDSEIIPGGDRGYFFNAPNISERLMAQCFVNKDDLNTYLPDEMSFCKFVRFSDPEGKIQKFFVFQTTVVLSES